MNNYYQEINSSNYPTPDYIVSLNKEAIKFIKNFYRNSNTTIKIEQVQTDKQIKKYISAWFNETCFLTIIETPDEWFYVSTIVNRSSLYYKCDQLEGLKKYFKEKQ